MCTSERHKAKPSEGQLVPTAPSLGHKSLPDPGGPIGAPCRRAQCCGCSSGLNTSGAECGGRGGWCGHTAPKLRDGRLKLYNQNTRIVLAVDISYSSRQILALNTALTVHVVKVFLLFVCLFCFFFSWFFLFLITAFNSHDTRDTREPRLSKRTNSNGVVRV